MAAAAVTDRVKTLDLAIMILSVGVLATSVAALVSPRGDLSRANVEIHADNRVWQYRLDSDVAVAVPGPLGETTVHIHDGRVSIVESPCENQTCVHSPAISRPGQWIACLPNAVMVLIEGSTDEDSPDATSW